MMGDFPQIIHLVINTDDPWSSDYPPIKAAFSSEQEAEAFAKRMGDYSRRLEVFSIPLDTFRSVEEVQEARKAASDHFKRMTELLYSPTEGKENV